MPTPDRTSLEQIVAAAREILRAQGLEKLTMQAVAEAVGVRAPSLYKRVRNRDDLVRLVTGAVARDLGDRLRDAAGPGVGGPDAAGPEAARTELAPRRPAPGGAGNAANPDDARPQLARMMRATRDFAHADPAGYHLIFARNPAGADLSAATEAASPILELATALAGPDDALEAARTLTAWAHGFISMELAGAFNLGGDLDRAFEYGVDRLVAAVSRDAAGQEDVGQVIAATTKKNDGRNPAKAIR